MIVKGTKQLGNFKKGINLYIPKRRSAAAPSGIPVASTTSVNVIDSNGSLTNTYYKESPDYWHPGGGDDKLVWLAENSRWEFRGDNDYLWGYNNSSGQNANYIPTTGAWIGTFIGTITITAA